MQLIWDRLRGAAFFVTVLALISRGTASSVVEEAITNAMPASLPTVTVTAQKQPEDLQKLPLSASVMTRGQLSSSGARTVSEAALYAPNVIFTEFSARKLSNARFRGIGASPANPAVTTFYDGVPQLNANSSSIELLGISQIELVRGPQAALFGRNTVGGLVNITSSRPPLDRPEFDGRITLGNYDHRDVRFGVSSPLNDEKTVGISFAGGISARDGYTVNTVTGNDLDFRDAAFGKAQAIWLPSDNWEVRFILTTESDRDGDYALGDIGSLNAVSHTVARDFEGFTHRDILAPTLLVNGEAGGLDVASISGVVWWQTQDVTDLDYTPFPLATRNNEENQVQFTQEFRVASPADAPVRLADELELKWQAGAFFFYQNYDQDAVNFLNPPLAPVSLASFSDAALDDAGYSLYGQGTVTAWEDFDATFGLRADIEHKSAELLTYTSPAFGPPLLQDFSDDYAEVSPQFALAWRFAPGKSLYGTVARGFKAGGFNAASPPGTGTYGQESSWNFEIGAKTSWLDERVRANAALFYTRWDDLQLNVPNPFAPGSFYIANAGSADSMGAEIEIAARIFHGLDVFASAGFNDAQFAGGSVSGGLPVGGNDLPFTPQYTASGGVEYSLQLCRAAAGYARAEIIAIGSYAYDDQNTARQGDYTLVNFRVGTRGRNWYVEGWMRNAFDTEYIPVALAYPGLAPSGFIGENGAPMTFGVTGGMTF